MQQILTATSPSVRVGRPSMGRPSQSTKPVDLWRNASEHRIKAPRDDSEDGVERTFGEVALSQDCDHEPLTPRGASTQQAVPREHIQRVLVAKFAAVVVEAYWHGTALRLSLSSDVTSRSPSVQSTARTSAARPVILQHPAAPLLLIGVQRGKSCVRQHEGQLRRALHRGYIYPREIWGACWHAERMYQRSLDVLRASASRASCSATVHSHGTLHCRPQGIVLHLFQREKPQNPITPQGMQ